MAGIADLEVGLHRRDAESYTLELRFNLPDTEAEVRIARANPAPVRFAFDRLRALVHDADAYGELLTQSLFGDANVQAAFAQAIATADSLQLPVRLRLFVGPSAPELHALQWERLRSPIDGSLLVTSERIRFSRNHSSADRRPIHLRPRGELRALALVANASDVQEYRPNGEQLAPIDVAAEVQRIADALPGLPVTALASGGSATLNRLSEQLHEGYDILYLVCHGALIEGEPRLWLEDEQGRAAVVAGTELVARLQEADRRPSLVLLASCQSAGDSLCQVRADAVAALGPRLAEAGIPAVVAMLGDVTLTTLAEFMPVFFRELLRDGQIDRAMAAARGAVRDRPDAAVPVLYMRLKSGRIWYVPGFAEDRSGFERWPAVFNNLADSHCTPIVGPGLIEDLLGSTREIARRWSEKFNFPMAPYNREDLPQVAQYLAVNQGGYAFPFGELRNYLREEIVRRHGALLPARLRDPAASLQELVAAAGAARRARDPTEPHRVLAGLPVAVYVTTNPDNQLADALAEAGREPRVVLCRWNDAFEPLPSVYDADPAYRPDVQHPLVFHLFGHFQQPDSLVLTEDDYFDYLIGVTANKDLIPPVVRRVLADSALLFLGFQMDDWNFRVLFRSVMSQEGRGRRRKYAHVAVQIDPEGGRIQDPERARQYLERYFDDADISIYWGGVEDFIRELHTQWRVRRPGPASPAAGGGAL